jgi:hypothetical protein
MIHYQSLQTNEVFSFETERSIGECFYNKSLFKKLTDAEFDTISLNDARTSRKQYIKNKRIELAENSFITYNGKTYSNSPNARIAILNYTQLLGLSDKGWYLTYPNPASVELTGADFRKISLAIQTNEINARQKEAIAYLAIDNAKSIEEVDKIELI